MNHRHPPSPPLSADGDIKSPFQDLSQNNTLQSPFLQNQHPFTTMYARQTAQEYPYGTIEVDHRDVPELLHTYPQNSVYSSVSGADFPQITSVPQLSLVRASQLTGQKHRTEMRRTRSGVSTSSRGSPKLPKFPETDKGRVQRVTRVRKRTRAPRLDKLAPIVNAPLSVLTKDMAHIPIRDMEAWVTRTAEVRREEVAARDGKIARPMNSFMLYRSAYAERTKEWCAQNNHQVVSRASGQSWPLEPKEIRDQYERYAAIERDNHQKAHPDYKFAPNKAQNTPKKRPAPVNEDENSDLEDAGFDITSCPRPMKKMRKWTNGSDPDEGFGSRTSTPFDKDSSYESRHSTPFDHPHGEMYLHHPDINRSSWEMINPGRPLPGMLSPPEQSHYYQPSIHQSLLGPNIEDVTYKKMGIPGVSYDPQGAMGGLPGNSHPELLGPHSSNRPVEDSAQVDPQLLEFNNNHHHHHHQQQQQPQTVGNYHHSQLDLWQMSPPANQHYTHTSMPETETYLPAHAQQSSFHHQTPLLEGREVWSETQGGEPLKQEFGQEFDQWLTGHPAY